MLLSGAAGTGLDPVLDRLVDAIGPIETSAKPQQDGEEPAAWSPI